MPKLIKITANTEAMLKEESSAFIETVQGNIRRAYPHNDYIRGAADTMRDGTHGSTLTVWGWQYFENVEKGIPPLIGFPLKPASPLVRVQLYNWSIRKGIQFATDSQRKSFAYNLRQKILKYGTALYRSGGRADIYTPEMEKLTKSVAEKAAKIIVNTDLL